MARQTRPKSRSMTDGSASRKRPVATKTTAAKRELIDTGTDKRFVRRDDSGEFNESDGVGRSLSQDPRRKAKKKSPSGQGDRGDRKRAGNGRK